MTVLLMTRPEAAAARFVEALPVPLKAQLDVLYSPLIRICPLPQPAEAGSACGVIFTSINGVAAAAGSQGLPAYCVGEATARAARKKGWHASACGGTAEALIETLIAKAPQGPLIHFRGAHARGNIASRLMAAGLECAEKVIYEQVLDPLTTAATAVLVGPTPVLVPLFSPRTAQHFSKLCPAEARPILLALSNAVAQPLKTLNYKDLQICSEPTAKAMVQAVQDAAGGLHWVEGHPEAQ